jgi:hypothetical protein
MHVSWKNISAAGDKIPGFFQSRFEVASNPLEASSKSELLGKKYHFLNERPLRAICGSKAALISLLRGAP